MYKFMYRVYYIPFQSSEQFIGYYDYQGFQNLLNEYDGLFGLRVYKFGKFILIVNYNKDYEIALSKA